GRPVVEVVKEKEGGYRIVGRYRGDVVFNRDRMSNVSFTFWGSGESWVLVDTNLTEERRRFAAAERERQKKKAMSGEMLLDYLQGIFHQKFPKAAFHEQVTEKMAAAKSNSDE